jgi:two-component system NarL family response regulator
VDPVETLRPDVILMDLNMPEIGGLTATEMILEQSPDTRILILSMHDSPEYISSALSHGAKGYVLKDVPTEEIKTAIDTVMRGERYLCTGAKGSLQPEGDEQREQLTGREQTVLLQLAQGKSNKEVALALDISVRTVETHRKNIKRKLGISSTAGLTRYALEHGVLQGTGVSLSSLHGRVEPFTLIIGKSGVDPGLFDFELKVSSGDFHLQLTVQLLVIPKLAALVWARLLFVIKAVFEHLIIDHGQSREGPEFPVSVISLAHFSAGCCRYQAKGQGRGEGFGQCLGQGRFLKHTQSSEGIRASLEGLSVFSIVKCRSLWGFNPKERALTGARWLSRHSA